MIIIGITSTAQQNQLLEKLVVRKHSAALTKLLDPKDAPIRLGCLIVLDLGYALS
jgi:hypothetical protein